MVAWQMGLAKCYHLPRPQSGFHSTLALLTFILAWPQHLTLPLFASSADMASQHGPRWKCSRSWGSKGEFLLKKEINAKLVKCFLRGLLPSSPVSGSIHQVIGVTLQHDVC